MSEGPTSTMLVSICIPAYKAERFLGETLESIRKQTFTDWDLIVVEDGSRDGTEQIVRDFAARVPQAVRFERHTENQGLPATRNTGIARTTGAWIALVDSDDIWTPEHLATLARKAEETGCDLIHSGVMLFDSDTGADVELRAPTPVDLATFPSSLFTGKYVIQPSSILLRRSLCEKVGGFDPSFRSVEDREYWLRLVRAGARVACTDVVSCRYRQHGDAMTRNAAIMARWCAEVFERNVDWSELPLGLRRRSTAEGWLSAGRIILRDNPALARRYFGRALRHRATSPRLLAYWLAAVMLASAKRARPSDKPQSLDFRKDGL